MLVSNPLEEGSVGWSVSQHLEERVLGLLVSPQSLSTLSIKLSSIALNKVFACMYFGNTFKRPKDNGDAELHFMYMWMRED